MAPIEPNARVNRDLCAHQRGTRTMDVNHPDNRIVQCFSQDNSKENIWMDAGRGVFNSQDVTPSFRLDLKSQTRYGQQDAPYPRASKPNLRVPLGPRPTNGGGNGNKGPAGVVVTATAPHLNVAAATLRAEVSSQEAETAALNARLARMERELGLMRKILHGFIEVHMIYHDRGQI